MSRLGARVTWICPTITLLLATACSNPTDHPASSSYDDLVALFHEWREFERPTFLDGVPDYSPAAMAAQHRELADYQGRLGAFDTSAWTVEQQIDHHLVRAETNGLDFDHRVRRPWARNPSFYTMIFTSRSDVPAHEGPIIHGWIDLWTYEYPLNDDDAAELAERIGAIPGVLEHAQENLIEDARDLWVGGIRTMAAQSNDLAGFANQVAGTSAELDAAIMRAREATNEFRAWLEGELPSKNGPSGVGKDNYTWYAHNVHLVPYTWEEQLTIMRRELARAHSSLRLEEHRNRDLPQLEQVASAAAYDRVFNAAVTEYMRFLEGEDIVTVRDYMDAALRARIGQFSPSEGIRGFFSEVSYRDPLTMRTHGHHWIELANMDLDPHSSEIRRVPSLSNIYDARSEGLATGMEEMMMHAGLFDDNPRARELIWILLAQRAARAIGGLMLHANELTVDETTQFASEWVPRGWLPADGATIVGEQHFYLQQPGYGTSYVTGKVQIERLMAERAIQLGDNFTMKGFMDEFTAAGVIPVSLVRWQLTGRDEEVIRMTTGQMGGPP
ncbi:MAG: DUF885 family protein [Gemmatimonadetes bacterium]|nr:DUF885 family protein [Gemmatimonadota bacterium]